MIPDFKTYIKESTWGDIRSRVNGDSTRKEDDVNMMDYHALAKYIADHYTCIGEKIIMETDALGGAISISLFEDESGNSQYLWYDGIDEDIHFIYIPNSLKTIAKNIFDDLTRNYSLSKVNQENYYIVSPINYRENISNKFFLEVLDFIIERVEKPLIKQIEKK